MKSNTILCLFLIAVSAFAVKTETETNLEEVFAELKGTDLGELIYSFAQLQSTMDDSRYAPLFDALATLRKSLLTSKTNENALYVKQTTHHNDMVEEYKKDIAEAV
jgi:hypothetical protein